MQGCIIFSINPVLQLGQTNNSESKATQDISWKDYPVLIDHNDTLSLDLSHLAKLMSGQLESPVVAANLDSEELVDSSYTIDSIFKKSIARYQRDLLEATSKDKARLPPKAISQFEISHSENALKQTKESCVFRASWIKTIDVLEKERIEKCRNIITERCESLYFDLEPGALCKSNDKPEVVDVKHLMELKLLGRMFYHITGERLKLPGGETLDGYLLTKNGIDLQLDQIKQSEGSAFSEIFSVYKSNCVATKEISPEEQAALEKGVNYFAQLKEKVKEGDGFALYSTGWCYANGYGVCKDICEAKRYYRLACEKNIPDAMYNLALLYDSRMGLDVNDDEAFYLLNLSASRNLSSGQYMLGYYYKHGIAVCKNEGEAFQWFQKAARQNHPQSLVELGKCYENGIECEQNLRKAFKLYLQSAELGCYEAQLIVGKCFKLGRGTPKDEKAGIKWCRSGRTKQIEFLKIQETTQSRFLKEYQCAKEPVKTERGQHKFLEGIHLAPHEEAKLIYSRAVESHRPKWPHLEYDYSDDTIQLLDQAASLGHPMANYRLGYMHFKNGNWNKAIDRFYEASERNNLVAKYILAWVIRFTKGIYLEENLPEMMRLINQAGLCGLAGAKTALGDLFRDVWSLEDGDSESKNTWLKLFAEEAKKGSVEAIFHLGEYYCHGSIDDKYSIFLNYATLGHANSQYALGMYWAMLAKSNYSDDNYTLEKFIHYSERSLHFLNMAILKSNRINLSDDKLKLAEAEIKTIEKKIANAKTACVLV